MERQRKTTALRHAISAGCVAMPGAFNAAAARLVERAGFSAVYVSGAGMANATAGVPDVGLLTLTEVVRLAGLHRRRRGHPGAGGRRHRLRRRAG